MNRSRTFLISFLVLLALFLLFRSAEASPDSQLLPTTLGEGSLSFIQPSGKLPVGLQALDAVADLSLGLKVSSPTPLIGGTLAYTVTVTNSGPDQAEGVAVRDLLPSGYTYTSNVPSQGIYDSSTGDWTGIVLPNGASAQLRLNATVNASGSYSNYAQVMASGATDPDSTPGNNSTTEDDDDTLATVPVVAGADLSLAMTDRPDPVAAGSTLVYTMTVTNLGTVNANSVVLTDTLPAGVTYQSYASSGWNCAAITGGRVRCTRNRINNGNSSWVALTLSVAPNAPATLSNSAVVKASTADPLMTNNTDTEITAVNNSANLGVTLADAPDPVAPGANLTYTVTVSNAGPSDAVGVVFTDTLSSSVTYQSFTGAGWSCTLTGVQLRCTSAANLVANTNSRVVILTQVNAGTAPGTLSNSVLVRSSTNDPVPANNSAAASTTVRVLADLKVSMTDSVDPVTPGTNMAYTIVITNTGPSDAVGVKITDTLPVGVSYISYIPTSEWTCTTVGSDLRCARAATVAVNQSVQLGVVVFVNADVTSPLSNVVRVGAATFDPVSANNTDTETTGIALQSDLSLTKSDSPDPVTAGTNLAYTLIVSNAGPSYAASLVLTDTLPANLTYLSFGGSSGWSCTLLAGNKLRCTRSSLALAASSTVTVQTKVKSSATGSLSNTAVVRSTGTDPSLADNTAAIATTVITRADLSVNKTDTPDPVAEGQTLTYRVVVKNNGPSDAAGTSLNESIPSGVNFVSAVAVPQGTCSGTGPVLCSLGSAVAGNSITVTLTTTAKLVLNVPKSISNTAAVSTTTTDPNAANNSQTISTQVLPAADLKINLDSLVTQIQTGSPLTYTLWITNTGPSIANNVVVTDTLPSELTYISSSLTPVLTSPKVVWNLGNLSAGQSLSFKLVVRVKSPTKTLVNTAATKSSTWDVFQANSQDQASVQAIDNVAPTATWELPVHLGGEYYVGRQIVRLEVLATDNVAVSNVKFYRWDALNNIFVDIGYDFSAATCQFNPAFLCYQWDLNTNTLNPTWNEIRARAYDESGNASPDPSQNTYFFLYRFETEIYLPFIKK